MFKKHPASLVKTRGELFIDKENKKCYRTVTEENQKFLTSSLYKEKSGELWINSSKKDSLTFDLEYVDHVIYWTEMTNKQKVDSLIFLCDVLQYLEKHDWTLETHMWNITIKNSKPILLDVGDFLHFKDKNTINHYKFTSICSILKNQVDRHTPIPMSSWIKNGENLVEKIKANISNLEAVKNLIRDHAISDDYNVWDSYDKDNYKTTDQIIKANYLNKKDSTLCDFIKENAPQTVTDLGCNSGKHSLFCGSLGIQTIGIDYAPISIDKATSVAKNLELPCTFISASLLDLEKDYLSLYGQPHERLKSEMAIAPAIIHHLFNQSKNADKVIDIICKFADKKLAIEFIPTTDPYIQGHPNWYTIEQITERLSANQFKVLDIKDSFPDGRKWIFANK